MLSPIVVRSESRKKKKKKTTPNILKCWIIKTERDEPEKVLTSIELAPTCPWPESSFD